MAINVGDIYFVSYFGNGTGNANAGNPSPEGFAIIVKNPIAAGEVLSFTDAGLQPNGTSFATNEQTINFTVPAGGIAANTVLEFPLNQNAQTTVYANTGSGSRTAIGTITPTGNAGLNNSGDQIFAFQGSLSQANVLAGIDVSTNSPITTGATGTTTTYAPTNGAPFVDFPTGTDNVQIAIDPTTATPSQLTNAANYTQNIATTTNPEASFVQITCFVSGTRIRTSRGDVAVEALAAGDLAATASGAMRPIRWIGHRLTDCCRHPRPLEVMPIRITAHAFGAGRPARDLVVSPGHAICVAALDEVLIPAGALVNGTTIVRESVETVTYWHVELDEHDVLLAENLPAESYLDMGNRAFFEENGVVALHGSPDAVVPTHADFCRPFHESGAVVEAVRTMLGARVARLGWRLEEAARLADLHLVVDRRRLEPVIDGLSAMFTLPADARNVWLVSETGVPVDVGCGADFRTLGVFVAAIAVADWTGASRITPAGDPSLCCGFHAVEPSGLRWTAGRARLPTALWADMVGEVTLRIDLAGAPLPRWVLPATSRVVPLALVG